MRALRNGTSALVAIAASGCGPMGTGVMTDRVGGHMSTAPPLANTITLGVQDLRREREFYRALGWPTAFDGDDFVAFELRGAVLTLFPVDKLAADSRTRPEVGQGGI